MPKKITERKTPKIRVNKKKVLRISEGIKKSNFNKAVVLLIIVVLGVFLFTFFQNRVKKGKFPPRETKVEEKFTIEISPTIEITGETYTVKPGDTVRGIALRAYGDENAWVKIAQANSIRNPNRIEAGRVLRIPR